MNGFMETLRRMERRAAAVVSLPAMLRNLNQGSGQPGCGSRLASKRRRRRRRERREEKV
jgi:hypothetical protein